MKTRNLLLMSLACGVAIMLAGAVFLFQLATGDDADEAQPLGTPAEVGDVTVTVAAASELDGRLVVDLELGGADDPSPADEFRLIASGRGLTPAATTCAALTVEAQRCTVDFDVSEADGVSRVLFYERGDATVRWVLA